jgi:TetR/AcrR family transcriptional regulator, lmrAB and yxaGH operons repressor
MSMSETRDRLLQTGERLFQLQGYAATGLKQLAAEAQAPWSSMYHFFPGGKEQMGAEIIRYAAARYAALIDGVFATIADPVEAVAAIFRAECAILEGSAFRNGCPVASVTLDVASTVEALRQPCAEAFASWIAAFARGFAAAGIDVPLAQDLATYVLSALEGAIVLSRAARDTAPLRRCADSVRRGLRAQITQDN